MHLRHPDDAVVNVLRQSAGRKQIQKETQLREVSDSHNPHPVNVNSNGGIPITTRTDENKVYSGPFPGHDINNIRKCSAIFFCLSHDLIGRDNRHRGVFSSKINRK